MFVRPIERCSDIYRPSAVCGNTVCVCDIVTSDSFGWEQPVWFVAHNQAKQNQTNTLLDAFWVLHDIYLANFCLQNECFLKPITKTFVEVSRPGGAPSALLPLTPYYWGCKKQLKAPPVSAFPLPPLLGNWKPLSIGAGVGPHLQLISHTDAPFGLQNRTKCWTLRPIVLLL